jgi:hypothetical protein
MSERHRGHLSGFVSSTRVRAASAPQLAQKRAPANIGAKHEAHVTVASAALQ